MNRMPTAAELARPKTLDHLFRRYLMTPEARSTAVNTRKLNARAFAYALGYFGGTTTLTEMDERGFRTRLYDWRDTFADRPMAGKSALGAICTVFNWAVDRGLMRDNPAAGMRKLQKTSDRSAIIWTPDDLAVYRAVARPEVLRVFNMSLWTGLRVSDTLDLRAFNFEEGWITATPQKTRRLGVQVHVPYYLLPPLAAEAVRLLSVRWADDAHVMRTDKGVPWSYRWFDDCHRATVGRAGLTERGLHFHDLRGTLITRMFEAGCTPAEAGSISGHAISSGSIKSYVTRSRPLAEGAFRKLAAYLKEHPVL